MVEIGAFIMRIFHISADRLTSQSPTECGGKMNGTFKSRNMRNRYFSIAFANE